MPASISKDTIDASSTTTSPMQFHETASRKFASGLFPSAPWTVRASIPVRSVRLRAALPVGAATTYGTKASLRSLKQCTMASMSVVLPQPFAPSRTRRSPLYTSISSESRIFLPPALNTKPRPLITGEPAVCALFSGSMTRSQRRTASLSALIVTFLSFIHITLLT